MSDNKMKINAQVDLSRAEEQLKSFLKKYDNVPVKIKVDVDAANSNLTKQLQTQMQAIERSIGKSLDKISKMDAQTAKTSKSSSPKEITKNPLLTEIDNIGNQFRLSTTASVKNAGKPKCWFHCLRYSLCPLYILW